MEKVNGKYILEGELAKFDPVNRNGSRIYIVSKKEDFYTEYYKNIKRIIKINKIWKKDTQ